MHIPRMAADLYKPAFGKRFHVVPRKAGVGNAAVNDTRIFIGKAAHHVDIRLDAEAGKVGKGRGLFFFGSKIKGTFNLDLNNFGRVAIVFAPNSSNF